MPQVYLALTGEGYTLAMFKHMKHKLAFSAGAVLVLLGALDLYLGLMASGGEVPMFAAAGNAFFLLFPGAVFISYSLQTVPRFCSESAVDEASVVNVQDAAIRYASGNVVVPFPVRTVEFANGKSIGKSQSK